MAFPLFALPGIVPLPARRLLALLILVLGGCRDRNASAPPHGARETAPPPQRIVCGSPAVTEIVFALGCGDRVVGVSDFSTFPPDAEGKTRIGGWINPNRERLLVLEPDIIVTQGAHETLAGFAHKYGIRFHAVELDTLEEIRSGIESIAAAVGVPRKGRDLAARVQRDIALLRQQLAGQKPKRVFLLFGRSPGNLRSLTTVGPESFLHQLIEAMGGTNIFADTRGAYPEVSKESVLMRQPEVILEVHPGGLPDAQLSRMRADWDALSALPAVQRDRVHYLTNDFLLLPGPRIVHTARVLAEALHPDAFGAPPERRGDAGL